MISRTLQSPLQGAQGAIVHGIPLPEQRQQGAHLVALYSNKNIQLGDYCRVVLTD